MLLRTTVTLLHHKEEFDGYRMDLAYITPQLIASAMPSTSYIQGFYRSNLTLLVKFLDTKHANHWHIWNLQQDCELGYDPSSVVDKSANQLVTRVPTPDHHPMAMHRLVATINDIHHYLQQDSQNVALIHCKCGKGRTGTVIAAYLMLYHGMTAQDACDLFTKKRMRMPIIPAVSISSQMRFLKYLEKNHHLVECGTLDATCSYHVTHIIVHNPTFTEYEVKLRSLTPGGPSIRDWSSCVRSNFHVLKHMESPNRLVPADLTLEFIGYTRVAGIKIPLTSITYSLNLEFENTDSDALSSELMPSPLLITHNSKQDSVPSQYSSSIQKSYCLWSDTEGIGGLPLRGSKGFDSIEICWYRSQVALGSPCFEEQVPSLNTYHEKCNTHIDFS